MKRKLSLIGAVALAAACAFAGGKVWPVDVVLTAATGGTNRSAAISGYVEEIAVYCSDGVSTGEVVVAAQRTGQAAYNLATNAVVGKKLWRPAVDATDTAGAALTSDPPRRYYLLGETVSFAVTGSPTNKTWRFEIKTAE
jgi:hypothetical protein